MDQENGLTRRNVLKAAGAAALAVGAGTVQAQEAREDIPLKGNIRHSVSEWCFKAIPLAEIARLGIESVELVGPGGWQRLKDHGLICAMTPSHGIARGLNRKEHHAGCLDAIRKAIEATADAGFPNVICFSGNRGGMDDDEGLKNCAEALKQIVPLAEERGVTLCMELLNSKWNHKDYMCDRTAWGVELCKTVGSERLKLLYDIYHMQIMEGDIIKTLRDRAEYIGHIHTAGVPGRHEIDDSQELNYGAIMRAVAASGYKGFVGQEFTPTRDPLTSLREAIRICDV